MEEYPVSVDYEYSYYDYAASYPVEFDLREDIPPSSPSDSQVRVCRFCARDRELARMRTALPSRWNGETREGGGGGRL